MSRLSGQEVELTMRGTPQPWLYSRTVDCVFIVGPAWMVTAALLAFPSLLAADSDVPPFVWLLAIVCVDVAHVYSTLFRTYFDRTEVRQRPALYFGIPLIGLTLGVLLYSQSAALFWTALAYLAVFHFVRQQYGFLMLYSRDERSLDRWVLAVDRVLIYMATLYPLIYWHTHLPTNFHWFVDGDFLALPPIIERIALIVYIASIFMYYVKERVLLQSGRPFNWPRNLLIGGTMLSWYVGIVVSKGDLGFTLANVLAHGIPYLALVWIYGSNQRAMERRRGSVFKLAWLPLFLAIPIGLAYFEESIWDAFVWRDHVTLFGWIWSVPQISSHALLSLAIPLLALPQITHYVLDAFIWRLKDNPEWRRILFHRSQST